MASVRQHGKRWQVRWRDATARQIVESFATAAEARARAREVEGLTHAYGTPPAPITPEGLTLERWWARWEPGRAWRPSTRATHDSHWRGYIKPVFGRVPLDTITTSDVERFHRGLERRGLARATIAAIHRTLSMVLAGAERDGLIPRNPARAARLPRKPEREVVVLGDTEYTAMLDALATTAPSLVAFAHVCAAGGLRRAEAAGLTWDRVDLDALELTIDRQLDLTTTTVGAEPVFTPTKTDRVRRVPIPKSLADVLRAHRAEHSPTVVTIGAERLVFTDPRGRAWARSTLADQWRRARDVAAEAGTPIPAGARGWHSLRHRCASRLVGAGVPPAEAAAMLGHNVDTLLSTYTHVLDQAAADARLRAALDG